MARFPNSLTLENVRCFADAQTGQVRRITLLVGENSAGKSTFLGCYRAFSRLASFVGLTEENYFDRDPFWMGDFPDICRGGAEEFRVGGSYPDSGFEKVHFRFGSGVDGYPEEHEVSISEHGGPQPILVRKIRRDDVVQEGSKGNPGEWRVTGDNFEFDVLPRSTTERELKTWLSKSVRMGYGLYGGDQGFLSMKEGKVDDSRRVEFAKMENALRQLQFPFPDARSEDDLPVFVIPTLENAPIKWTHGWNGGSIKGKAIYPGIEMLGELELFMDIKRSSQPYRPKNIKVKTRGGWHDFERISPALASLLPLVVFMRAQEAKRADSMFLLEKPEKFLHPKTQAELATAMIQSGQRYLIETHSEHFSDRFRIEVMNGNLSPEDLNILYFERSSDGKSSTLHNIGVEKDGNLIGVPKSYVAWKYDEMNRLLGFKKD